MDRKKIENWILHIGLQLEELEEALDNENIEGMLEVCVRLYTATISVWEGVAREHFENELVIHGEVEI